MDSNELTQWIAEAEAYALEYKMPVTEAFRIIIASRIQQLISHWIALEDYVKDSNSW